MEVYFGIQKVKYSYFTFSIGMNMKKNAIVIVLVLMLLLPAVCYSENEKTAKKYKYICNPEFHGAFVYSYWGSLDGILLNGTPILSTWIWKYDPVIRRTCIRLPGMNEPTIWIDPDMLADEWPADAEPDLLTGITMVSDEGKGKLVEYPGDVDGERRFGNGDRVRIAGRIDAWYYLPDVEPHYLLTDDISCFAEHKHRNYSGNLLSFAEVSCEAEADGTETMKKEEAFTVLDQAFHQYFPDLQAEDKYYIYLDDSHINGPVGKTWMANYYHESAMPNVPRFYSVEIADKTKALLNVSYAYDMDAPYYYVKDGIAINAVK